MDFRLFIHLVVHSLRPAPGCVDTLRLMLTAGLSQQLLVVQSSSQRASHMSRGVFHVPSCSDGPVQRGVCGAQLTSGQGASCPHLRATSDPWGWAGVVVGRHVEGRWVQQEWWRAHGHALQQCRRSCGCKVSVPHSAVRGLGWLAACVCGGVWHSATVWLSASVGCRASAERTVTTAGRLSDATHWHFRSPSVTWQTLRTKRSSTPSAIRLSCCLRHLYRHTRMLPLGCSAADSICVWTAALWCCSGCLSTPGHQRIRLGCRGIWTCKDVRLRCLSVCRRWSPGCSSQCRIINLITRLSVSPADATPPLPRPATRCRGVLVSVVLLSWRSCSHRARRLLISQTAF